MFYGVAKRRYGAMSSKSGAQMLGDQRLRFLMDANVLIPLEPTSPSDIEPGTDIATDIVRQASKLGFHLLVHPETKRELASDRDPSRAAARQTLVDKYEMLPDPPDLSEVERVLGVARPQSNNWFDHLLLAALHANAVHYLITNDQRMHRKARRLGISSERILTLAAAHDLLDKLADHPQNPPPQVRTRSLHALRRDAPIFESLREDYPNFDRWFRQVSQEGRQAWVIEPDGGDYAGICIWKLRDDELRLGGKVMKISTFKVAEEHRGRRYGELLLKAAFNELRANRYDHVWLTVFERHETLIAMLEDFGFYQHHEKTDLGELIYVKDLTADQERVTDPFEYHRRYGPPAVDLSLSPVYVIPIQPRYHRRLFPDDPHERMLIGGNAPYGNAIRKAYLSRSLIQSPPPGAVILFYRSDDQRAVTAIGVVEDALRISDPVEIAKFAGQRTVYSFREIEELAQQPVLTILFRQDRLLEAPWPLRSLIAADVLTSAPQSITQVHNEEAIRWLSAQLAASP